MLPDLLSFSDSSTKEGAYLNEMEGPSFPGANSITCPQSPGYYLFTPERVSLGVSELGGG